MVQTQRTETGHKPNIRGALIFFLIFSSLTFTTPKLRDSKSKMSFEADNSEILDPIVTAISFSSMKVYIFSHPVPGTYLQTISQVFIYS